jgi:hypothetical protein
MNRIANLLFALCILVAPILASADEQMKFPWSWDMTPDQVKAVIDSGPYRNFQNGDLETYNGTWDGRKENFQFFFKDNKLWRIGIYFYEGPDAKVAAQKWLELHASLQKNFGPIETPDNKFIETKEGEGLFKKAAIEAATKPGKTQMAPFKQPGDAGVFASFYGYDFQGQRIYQVILYLSKRT